jgi:hypothetical protein
MSGWASPANHLGLATSTFTAALIERGDGKRVRPDQSAVEKDARDRRGNRFVGLVGKDVALRLRPWRRSRTLRAGAPCKRGQNLRLAPAVEPAFNPADSAGCYHHEPVEEQLGG